MLTSTYDAPRDSGHDWPVRGKYTWPKYADKSSSMTAEAASVGSKDHTKICKHKACERKCITQVGWPTWGGRAWVGGSKADRMGSSCIPLRSCYNRTHTWSMIILPLTSMHTHARTHKRTHTETEAVNCKCSPHIQTRQMLARPQKLLHHLHKPCTGAITALCHDSTVLSASKAA